MTSIASAARRLGLVAAVPLLLAGGPERAAAQQSGTAFVGGGAGITFYCVVTRCDGGTELRAIGGYALSPSLLVEGGVRWHDCFDCDRFLIAETGLQLRMPGEGVRPFVSVGVGIASDPELMGTRFGPWAAVGTWVGWWRGWGLQVEGRGRLVGSGDYMIEVGAAAGRWLGG